MAANGPREVICELVSLFRPLNVGIRLATDIRISSDVYSRSRACRDLRIVAIGESATSVLEAKLVDLVVAYGPGILKHAGDIAIGLFRSAGVRVLPERLIFAAHFDTGNGTGAHVAAERQAMIRAEVVVEAQRIQTRTFKDREIPLLRLQRLIRRRHRCAQASWRTTRRKTCPGVEQTSRS